MVFTKEELMKLVEAGYTKTDIDNMAHTADSSKVVSDKPSNDPDQRGNDPDPNEGNEESAENIANQSLIEASKFLKEFSDSVTKQIDDLKKAYQEYNINQANNQVETAQGAVDILGTIIDPPFMNKKD